LNTNLCEIGFVLDRSGSMNAMKEEAIGGINAFLESQQKLPGEARLTLVLFDHEYIVTYDGVPIKDVPPLDSHSYVPRGTTALLDAIGRTINTIGERLDKTPEPERPGKVIVAILTDGLENASQEFKRKEIFKMNAVGRVAASYRAGDADYAQHLVHQLRDRELAESHHKRSDSARHYDELDIRNAVPKTPFNDSFCMSATSRRLVRESELCAVF